MIDVGHWPGWEVELPLEEGSEVVPGESVVLVAVTISD